MSNPKKRPAWRSVYVLSRKDPDGPYCKENCHWRRARTEKEARTGIEEGQPGEPESIPLTDEQRREFARIRGKADRRMFLIWARMLWRADQRPESN